MAAQLTCPPPQPPSSPSQAGHTALVLNRARPHNKDPKHTLPPPLHGCRSCTGCTGCPRREWRPELLLAAARRPPPHQQVPTWGRPIHEVGAVGRRGGEVERGGGGIARGASTPLPHNPPSFIPSLLLPPVARALELQRAEQRSSLSGLKAHTAHS